MRFSIYVEASESITFTTNGEAGHVFRFVLKPDGYQVRAFPPDGEKKSVSAGNGKDSLLPDGEWIDLSFSYAADQVVVRIGDAFEKTFQHPSFQRDKKNLSISFNKGTFSIRSLKATASKL